MAVLKGYRARQSTATTGSGTLTLEAAAGEDRSFTSAYGVGPVKVRYVIQGDGYFEMGVGTYTDPDQLARSDVWLNSSGTTSPITLAVATVSVFGFDVAGNCVEEMTATRTLALKDESNLIKFTGTTATLNLMAISTVPNGWSVPVENSGSGDLTIDPASTETVNGATTLAIKSGEQGWLYYDPVDAEWKFRYASQFGGLGWGTAGQLLKTTGSAPAWTNPPVQQSQVITANGNFTIPAAATADTQFKFRMLGGGGSGGSGISTDGAAGGGGGCGGYLEVVYKGFTAGQNVTVAIGAGGVPSTSGAGTGGGGGSTTITYAAVVVGTAAGGSPGVGNSSATAPVLGGLSGGASAAVGASGLTQISSTAVAATTFGNAGGVGVASTTTGFSGAGGSCAFGMGGNNKLADGVGVPSSSGSKYGGGGGGGYRNAGSDRIGGYGSDGLVIVEWVL